MARQKSVVLTPAEKKTALKEAKSELKEAKVYIKTVQGSIKAAEAAFKKEIKELNKDFTIASGVAERVQRRINDLTMAPA
jgi:ribosome recycling factor